jgi:PAS domain S-box-containing protein
MRKSYYPQLQREAEFLKEKSAALLKMLTDLEEARKKLEDSESMYRSIFENTGTATVIIEEDQKISLANSQFADLSGYPREETEGKKSWTDFIAEEDLERMQEYHRLRRTDLNAAPHGCEFHFVDRQGQIREIFLTMDRIAGTSKSVASLLDITERKRAEEQSQVYLRFFENLEQVERAIRKAQDLDQMVLDVLDTVRGIFRSDRAWLLHSCDPDAPFFRVLMIRTDDKYPVDLTPDVDLLVAPDVAEAFRTALSTNGPVTFDPKSGRAIPLGKEYSIRSQMILAVHPRVGKPWVFGMHQCSYVRVWTEAEQHLFNEIGRRMADGLGNMLFLRELRKNEEKYRTLVETLNEGLVVLDPTGVITYNNRAMAEMLGYSENELMGKLGTDFADKTSRKMLKERFAKQAAGEIVSDNYEATLTGKDGRSVPVLMSTNALLHKGAFKGTVVAIVDLTKHKQAQDALKESEERYRRQFEHASGGVY